MSRLGFGFGSPMRNSGQGGGTGSPPTSVPVKEITPSAGFSGVAGSGFGGAFSAVPADPVRTTAKPACRLLVAPNQYFTDAQLVGVLALANNDGSMVDNLGLEKVVIHYEGNTADILQPSFHTFEDANGTPVSYLGWWAYLRHNGTHGHGDVYFEAIPADATMQHRVIGPYQFSPQATIHDFQYTITPSLPNNVAARRFTDFDQLFYYLLANPGIAKGSNPHVRITEAHPSGYYQLNAWIGTYTPQGYMTIEADVPVVFGRPSGAISTMRPRWDGLHFKGSNITIDQRYFTNLYHEGTARLHWFDGITMTDTGGRYYLEDKGQRAQTGTRNGGWMTECTVTNLQDVANGFQLIRGTLLATGCRDAMSASLCMVDVTIDDWTSQEWRTPIDALTVQYTGAGTGTLSLSGVNEASSRTFTAKVAGSSVGTFVITGTNPAGNYDVQDVADWINSLTDWTATVLDDTRRATSLAYLATTIGAFTDLDVKTSAKTLQTVFDHHSDIWQTAAGVATENVIMWGVRGFDLGTQDILIGGTSAIRDMILVNCAFSNVPAEIYGESAVLFSQLSGVHSHVVVAHCSNSAQAISLRTDLSSTLKYNPDAYCAVINSTFPAISWGGTADNDLRIAGNHTHSGTPTNATDHSTGGDRDSLFVDELTGDFTPAGDLLTNLKTPVVAFDQAANERGAIDAAGALLMV